MLALGNGQIRGVRVGDRLITQVRHGTEPLWSASQMRDDFNRPSLGDLWRPTSNTAADRQAIIVNGSVRLDIPGGLIAEATRGCGTRFIGATATSNDGWLEFRVGTRGADVGHLSTYVGDWAPQNDNVTHLVGVELVASSLFIIRRVNGTQDRMEDCGAYQPGDVIRLVTNGNNFSLYRQGKFVGGWNDEGSTVARGEAYRSMVMGFSGDKGFFGPRRFSAAIDHIEHS